MVPLPLSLLFPSDFISLPYEVQLSQVGDVTNIDASRAAHVRSVVFTDRRLKDHLIVGNTRPNVSTRQTMKTT